MIQSGTRTNRTILAVTLLPLSACGTAGKRQLPLHPEEDHLSLTNENPAAWRPIDSISAPSPRARQTTVTNGNLVAVWGGYSKDAEGEPISLSDGGIFNPDTVQWSRFSAPTSAVANLVWTPDASAVLTSNMLIVWNGYLSGGNRLGAALDLNTNTWSAIGTGNSPSTRRGQQQFLVEDSWIIFGGGTACELLDGSILNTTNLSWTSLATAPAEVAAGCDNAIAVGKSLFVWGGSSNGDDKSTGAIFNIATNSWQPLPATGAPTARRNFTLQASGDNVFVIGGVSGEGATLTRLRDAYVYSTSNGVWTKMDMVGGWQSTKLLSAKNATNDIFLFGHSFSGNTRDTGFLFSAQSGSWIRIPSHGAPSARLADSPPVALSGGFLVWGGSDENNRCSQSGAQFTLSTNSWNSLPLHNAPAARRYASQIWTSAGLFVWGGCACDEVAASSCYRNDGALLNL